MTGPHADIVPIALPTPFIVGPVNVFLITRAPVTLVDTGIATDESYGALTAALQAQGLTIPDIEIILVTHGHVDHIGQLQRLAEESGAEVWGHVSVVPPHADPREAERTSREFLLGIFRQFGVPDAIVEETRKARENLKGMGGPPRIDRTLEDGGRVFEFEAIHVPGHSSSDTLFVDRARRLAFTGDHVLKGVSPTPVIRRDPNTGERVKSLLEFERSLARTRALGLTTMYPGHGAVITDPGEVIDRIFQRHERRNSKVLDALKEGPRTPYDVALTLFPELPPEHIYLALSTAIGHLDALEERGQAVWSEREDGTVCYWAQ